MTTDAVIRASGLAKKAPSSAIIGATSAAPASSRQECIESMGLPRSTARIPTEAAASGPIVEPQARSLRVTKCCGVMPSERHSAVTCAMPIASLA